MRKLYLAFLIFNLLSFSVYGQNNREVESKILFKETITPFLDLLMMQKAELNCVQSHLDSINNIVTPLISKYFTIYQIDTTNNKFLEYYIADCYRFNRHYDSAIYWYKHEMKTATYEINDIGFGDLIAQCYLYSGQLDSAFQYLKIAALSSERSEYVNSPLTSAINLAINISKYCDFQLEAKLRALGLKRCGYSLEILNRIKPLTTAKNFYSEKSILVLIEEVQRNCN